MRHLSRLAPLAMLTAAGSLASCQKADNQPGPGGVTVSEARALDEAAEMIENRRPVDEKPGSGGNPDNNQQ